VNRAWIYRRRLYPPTWFDLAPYTLTALGRLMADLRQLDTDEHRAAMRTAYNRKRKGHR
jgi:hypothetical protein